MAGDPKAIGDRLRAELAKIASALTLEVTAELVEACPVDTSHCRSNFVPSIGEAHDGEDDGAAQQAGIAAVMAYRLGAPLHISNNVPYLGRLIGGSSSQAPVGWDVAAIDRGIATIQGQYAGSRIDVSSSGEVSARGAAPAGNLAGAYSPFGGDE